MAELKAHQDLNGEIKYKMIEYSESIALLENKINEITTKGENCGNCCHMLNENEFGDTFNSINITSEKGDINKVNAIPVIPVKMMSHEESIKSFNTFNKIPNNMNNYLSNKEIIESFSSVVV